MQESFPEHVAAVDLGSNSFHMIVARVIDGRLHVLDRLREPVRLAAGLDGRNHITEPARRRAIECLQRFGQRLQTLPSRAVRAVGTNTLRKARNSESFLAHASQALGHPIETIMGREEARLVYLGVAHSVATSGEGMRLVVDIGGGSTELIIGKQFNPLHRESLHMGCVSSSEQYFPDGTVTRKALRRAGLAARLELRPISSLYRSLGWETAIGSSGTIRSAFRVARDAGWCDESGITPAALERILQTAQKAGSVAAAGFPELSADRVPVFIGGIVVLHAVFEALGIERMLVSDGALREGLLYDLLGRWQHTDVRSETIARLVQQYRVDTDHAGRVERTAINLFQQCAEAWQLPADEYADYLSWAAQLHEIGLAVAHNQYHKHGAYLLQYGDLDGFSYQEQRVLALLVRYHRRKLVNIFDDAPDDIGDALPKLAVLLRLAVLLHRNRQAESAPELRIKPTKKRLQLEFPQGWLEQHPLTLADLEREQHLLENAGVNLRFE